MDYTRIAVHGTTRRAQVVVPNDQPLAEVIARLADMLDEPPHSTGLVLVTVDGCQLDPEQSLAEQDVLDGSLLRLVAADRSPAPPEVSDVTEAAAEHRAVRRDLFTLPMARRVVAVLAAPWAVVTTALALRAAPVQTIWALAALLLVVAALAWRRVVWPTPALLTATAGAAATLGWQRAPEWAVHGAWFGTGPGLGDSWIGRGLVATAAAALVVGLLGGLASRRSSQLVGGLAIAAGAACLPLCHRLGLRIDQSAVVVSLLGTVLLGFVPSIALALSGLNGLDDQVSAGRRPGVDRVRMLLEDANASLTGLVWAVCLPLAVAMAMLVRLDSPWARALLGCLLVVLVARGRLFPLTGQVLAIVGVATAVLVSASRILPASTGLALWGMALVVALVVLLAPAPAHVAARLRGLVNGLEGLAVLALLPLALGWFGVFADLMKAFSR